MKKLKMIKLENFQKHKELTIDFNKDINLITGLSNKGKSCIRRAIDWVIFCLSISEKDLRKEGSKVTTVTLLFNDDIEVEKVRSTSINRYVLRIPDEAEQIFDSFGKTTPEEVRNAIGMSQIDIEAESLNLNISEQLTLPFLLDKSPSFRAKLFNKLTGNELLDSLFKKCNKESLRIGRDIKSTEELLHKQEDDVFEYSNKYKVYKNKLACVQSDFAVLKEKAKLNEKLNNIAISLKEKSVELYDINMKLSSIKTINEETIYNLRKKCVEFSQYSEIWDKLSDNDSNLQKISKIKISLPVINFDDLRKRLTMFENMKMLLKRIESNNKQLTELEVDIFDSLESVEGHENTLKEVWKNCDTCPLCKGKLNHVK